MTDLATRPHAAAKRDAPTARDIQVTLTVDAELLLEAQRQISAESVDAAVHEALRRLVDQERAKRDEARARLRRMYDSGELEFDARTAPIAGSPSRIS